MSASLMVQAAVLAALAADAALAGAVSGIFDGVSPGATMPYVTLGPQIVSDWSHKSGQGREHRLSLTVWDDQPGTARVQTLLARIETAVQGLGGSADGQRIASVLFLRSFATRIADGPTQGIAEFRIRTEAI